MSKHTTITELRMAAVLIAASITTGSQAADIQWLSQHRWVGAATHWDNAYVEAPDWAPFDASASLFPPPPPPDIYGSAAATQRSQLLTSPTGVFAVVSAEASGAPGGYASGARSECVIRFELSAPSEFTFYTNLDAWPPDFGTFSAMLVDSLVAPGGPFVFWVTNYDRPPPWPSPVSITGTLEAGTYDYRVFAEAGSIDTFSHASMQTWFFIPEPTSILLIMAGAVSLRRFRGA